MKRSLQSILEECKIQAVYEGRKSCYFQKTEKPFAPITTIRNSYAKTNLEQPIRFFDDPVLDFDKFVILTDENSNLDLFHERTKEHFDFIAREEMHPYGFEEVVPKGCSKAGGIDYIVEHLGESLASCYVFGDSTNDLSMLMHVKNSIAMGNSYPEVLANTSYVTTPIERWNQECVEAFWIDLIYWINRCLGRKPICSLGTSLDTSVYKRVFKPQRLKSKIWLYGALIFVILPT